MVSMAIVVGKREKYGYTYVSEISGTIFMAVSLCDSLSKSDLLLKEVTQLLSFSTSQETADPPM